MDEERCYHLGSMFFVTVRQHFVQARRKPLPDVPHQCPRSALRFTFGIRDLALEIRGQKGAAPATFRNF
jgi:hypothetical protein